MHNIRNPFLGLFGFAESRDLAGIRNDPRLAADFTHTNLSFGIASGLLLCMLSLILLVGTYAPFSEGAVLPVINATFVYLVLLVTNLVFVVLLHRERRRFHGVAEKLTARLLGCYTGVNMVLASLTFYSTQKDSSFFFEYILVTLTYPVASHGGSHARDSGWGRC